MAKPFIGIKKLWYGPVLTQKLGGITIASGVTEYTSIEALLAITGEGAFTEVKNVHDGTWGYSHDDPDVQEYINELTGQPYYRDKTSLGARTITFTLGVFEFQQKADLQGGSVVYPIKHVAASGETPAHDEPDTTQDPIGWESSGALENLNKCIIAQTKTGNYIVFSNASIVAKGDQQEKNIGLGITAVCMENETTGVQAEYMYGAQSA